MRLPPRSLVFLASLLVVGGAQAAAPEWKDAKGATFRGEPVEALGLMAQTSLLPFVQKFEGYNPKPYWDHKQWSVGYGTRASGPNETIDKAEADRRLQAELDQSRGYVTQRFPNLAPHQADALTSFTYNLGPGWMSQPTKLRAAIESGDYQSAASVMQSYNKASGQVLPGLQNRRAAEAAMFLGGPAPTSLLDNSTGAQPMPQQENKGWLGLLSERFESPLFMMGASLFNNAYQPGGNIGAGLMQGMQASSAMQRQKIKDQRERLLFEQQQKAGPMLAQAFSNGQPDIGALMQNPATRDIALDLYKQQQAQNDPLRKAQTEYYGAQTAAKTAEAQRLARNQNADEAFFAGAPAAPSMPAAPVPTEGAGRFAAPAMAGPAQPAPGSFQSLPPQIQAAAMAQLRAGNRDEAYKIVSEGFIKPPSISSNLSVAEKAVDKEFAKTYGELVVDGGAADVKKNLNALRAVAKNLPTTDRLTGPIVGRIPDAMAAFVNPQSVAARENVEEVVQRNLRVILGAQFTNEEGKRLIARAYNPTLSEGENAKRLNSLISAMDGMLNAKMQAADYYERNGTLKGFRGAAQFSIADLEAAIDKPEQKKTDAPSGGARVIGVR